MNGRVVRVVDGDTIHVRVGRRLEKVRHVAWKWVMANAEMIRRGFAQVMTLWGGP